MSRTVFNSIVERQSGASRERELGAILDQPYSSRVVLLTAEPDSLAHDLDRAQRLTSKYSYPSLNHPTSGTCTLSIEHTAHAPEPDFSLRECGNGFRRCVMPNLRRSSWSGPMRGLRAGARSRRASMSPCSTTHFAPSGPNSKDNPVTETFSVKMTRLAVSVTDTLT